MPFHKSHLVLLSLLLLLLLLLLLGIKTLSLCTEKGDVLSIKHYDEDKRINWCNPHN